MRKVGDVLSEAWSLRENEKAILQRIEKAIIRAMRGVKLIEQRSSQEVTDLLGLEETLDRLAKANGIRWYEDAWRRDSDDVLRKPLHYEVVARKGRERPKMAWRRQAE